MQSQTPNRVVSHSHFATALKFISNSLPTLFIVALVASISFSASIALASKARLRGLGQNVDGSQFVLDNRDIFLNPANINDLPSSANFEWGGQTTAAPKAEGGGIYRTSSLGSGSTFGLQLGRLGDATQNMIASNTSIINSGQLFYPQNSLDAIFGMGGANLRWGAGLHYARSVSNVGAVANFPQSHARDVAVSAGVKADRLGGYLKLDLLSDANTDLAGGGSITYTGKPSGEIGGKFDIDAVDSLALVYTRRLYSFNNGSGTQGDVMGQTTHADFYRQLLGNDKTFLFATGGLSYSTTDIAYQNLGSQPAKLTTLTSPIVLGLEHKAMTWLTLRASASQNLLLDQNKRVDGLNDFDRANLEDTIVAAGLSAYLGNMQIDATFEGADNSTGAAGKLNATNLAANASFTYTF